jgi:hypothetical protein
VTRFPATDPGAQVPAPPPLAPLFDRRKLWLIVLGSVLLLGAAVAAAAVLAARAASSASSAQAAKLAETTSVYRVAEQGLAAHSATFQALVQADLSSSDFQDLPIAADQMDGAVASFDGTITRLQFPARMRRDLDQVLGADNAMSADLETVPSDSSSSVQTWLATIREDYAAMAAAHSALNADLGIASAELPGAASNNI